MRLPTCRYPTSISRHSAGFAAFANQGLAIKQHFITKVVDDKKKTIYEDKALPTQGKRLLAPEQSDVLTDILTGVRPPSLANNRPFAAKTGTWELASDSKSNAHAWMVGYTKQLATAVWVGNVGSKQTAIKDKGGNDIGGSGLPSDIWKRYMDAALKGEKVVDFLVSRDGSRIVAAIDRPASDIVVTSRIVRRDSAVRATRARTILRGADAQTRDVVVDSLEDWKDSDELRHANGAESDDHYLHLPVPYRARNSRLQDVAELRQIRGITPALYEGRGAQPGLAALTTVHGRTAVNINTAPAPVLAALATSRRPDEIVPALALSLMGAAAFVVLVAASFAYLNRAIPDAGTAFTWSTKALGPTMASSRAGAWSSPTRWSSELWRRWRPTTVSPSSDSTP